MAVLTILLHLDCLNAKYLAAHHSDQQINPLQRRLQNDDKNEVALDADFVCTVDSVYTSKPLTQSEVEACKSAFQEACTCETIYYACVFGPDSTGELIYT